jgi:hypothetical protein
MLILGTALTATGSAYAQEHPEDFTPQGYEFCGWQDYEKGGWTHDYPGRGAYLRGFARDLSCRTARRHITRIRYTQQPPYRPVRRGYRCKTIDSDYEYSDVRCIRRGGKKTFRFQTGS